jgi:predicted exporter
MRKLHWYLLVLISTIVLVFVRLDIRTDITDFFFTGGDADSAFLINQFSADSLQRRIILSIAHPASEPGEVSAFIDEFRVSLSALKGVERVWSSALDESSIEQLFEIYADQQVHLLSLAPETQIPALFEPAQLQARVARIKSILLGPDPLQAKVLLQKDPMLLTLDWLTRIKSTFSRPRQADDHTVLFVQTSASGMDINAHTSVQQEIKQLFDQLKHSDVGTYQLASTGVPVFASKIKAEVSRDIQRVSGLSMLAIMALFIVVFRSPKALLLTALMLISTISAAVLITQTVFGYVHGLTLALGATLIGICIDYFIHAMIHGSAQSTQFSEQNVRKIWPSLLLGGATTLIGYFALAASGFPGLQQIAVFSASGIVIALLITRFVIPDLMRQFDLHLKPALASERLLKLMHAPVVKLGLPLIAIIVFLGGIFAIQWSDDLQDLSPNLEQLKTNDNLIRSRMASIEPGRFILVEAADTELALQLNEQVHAALANLQSAGVLEDYFPVFPWIASKQLQKRNAQSWNKVIESELIKNWDHALVDDGFSVKAFPALSVSDAEYVERKTLTHTIAEELLSRQLMRYDDKSIVVTWLGKHDVTKLKEAIQAMPGARYFSQRESIDALATSYRQKAAQMLILGLLAILVLLIWRFRSIKQALKVLSPAILSIGFVLGIAGILQSSLNMLHLVGLLLTAAICVDYGIFFAENRSGNHQLAFQAITASALTSAASFASLGVAQNPALQALAWTVAPGILIGFLLCPILLRPASDTAQKPV